MGLEATITDERTEIILAATFLLIVILSFMAFVIQRCEKSYYYSREAGEEGGGGVASVESVHVQTVSPGLADVHNIYNYATSNSIQQFPVSHHPPSVTSAGQTDLIAEHLEYNHLPHLP